MPFKERTINHMNKVQRICFTALLVLQAIALPMHAFAQEVQHLAVGINHHHAHNHSEDVTSDHKRDTSSAIASDFITALTIDSGEHSCVGHCHVPAALLGSSTQFKLTGGRFIATHEFVDFAEHLPKSIERPKWDAARS